MRPSSSISRWSPSDDYAGYPAGPPAQDYPRSRCTEPEYRDSEFETEYEQDYDDEYESDYPESDDYQDSEYSDLPEYLQPGYREAESEGPRSSAR